MTMPPRLRKFAFTAHVIFSVGWLGAVAAYLALAVTGLISQDPQLVRVAYLAMELIGWFVIVPFSLLSLSSGLVQALGTEWGLFRHYWILTKFVLATGSTVILLVHMRTVGRMAAIVRETDLHGADLDVMRRSLVVHPVAGLFVLLSATVLSVYKPWGRTPFGRRKQREKANVAGTDRGPVCGAPWRRYVLIGIMAVILFSLVLHLAGGSLHGR